MHRDPDGRVAVLMLDAAEWSFLEARIDDGAMPELAALVALSVHVPLRNTGTYTGEAGPTVFVTGRPPADSGYWSMLSYDPASYEVVQGPASTAAPFYRSAGDWSTIVFDVPHMAIHRDLDVVQVAAWGAHGPQWPRSSHPYGLLSEIDERFGPHPGFGADYPTFWYRPDYADRLADVLVEGARRRIEISTWLMSEHPQWRLFVTSMSEVHSMLHHTVHAFDPHHPLFADRDAGRMRDASLRVISATDAAIGDFVRALPADATPVVCAAHGMRRNSSDLGADVILPELLGRLETGRPRFRQRPRAWDARGRPTIRPTGRLGPTSEMRRHFATSGAGWATVLAMHADPVVAVKHQVRRVLRRPAGDPFPVIDEQTVAREAPPDAQQPRRVPQNLGAQWLQPWWHEMRWFALPSYSDGHIRINLAGREGNGIVPLDMYDAACDEVEAIVRGLRDARTGVPVVADVLRPRGDAPIASRGPDADIVVKWTEVPFDAVTHPGVGRLGPFPFQRMSQHSANGFALVPGARAPRTLAERSVPDLVRTIVELAGLDAADLPGASFREELGPNQVLLGHHAG